jgi:hypothetical protein
MTVDHGKPVMHHPHAAVLAKSYCNLSLLTMTESYLVFPR